MVDYLAFFVMLYAHDNHEDYDAVLVSRAADVASSRVDSAPMDVNMGGLVCVECRRLSVVTDPRAQLSPRQFVLGVPCASVAV